MLDVNDLLLRCAVETLLFVSMTLLTFNTKLRQNTSAMFQKKNKKAASMRMLRINLSNSKNLSTVTSNFSNPSLSGEKLTHLVGFKVLREIHDAAVSVSEGMQAHRLTSRRTCDY